MTKLSQWKFLFFSLCVDKQILNWKLGMIFKNQFDSDVFHLVSYLNKDRIFALLVFCIDQNQTTYLDLLAAELEYTLEKVGDS